MLGSAYNIINNLFQYRSLQIVGANCSGSLPEAGSEHLGGAPRTIEKPDGVI
jgi:hypothetical protein